jgi:hypothetical protein
MPRDKKHLIVSRKTQSEIARFIGISVPALCNCLKKSGAPQSDSDGLYSAVDVVVFWRLGKGEEGCESVTREDMELIKAAGIELDNERKEIEIAERLNKLVPVDDVVDLLRTIAAITNGIGKELYGTVEMVGQMEDAQKQRELNRWWTAKMQEIANEVENYSAEKGVEIDDQDGSTSSDS